MKFTLKFKTIFSFLVFYQEIWNLVLNLYLAIWDNLVVMLSCRHYSSLLCLLLVATFKSTTCHIFERQSPDRWHHCNWSGRLMLETGTNYGPLVKTGSLAVSSVRTWSSLKFFSTEIIPLCDWIDVHTSKLSFLAPITLYSYDTHIAFEITHCWVYLRLHRCFVHCNFCVLE